MKSKVWTIVTMATLLFFSGAVAGFFFDRMLLPDFRHGPPGPPSREMVKGMMNERVSERLSLSEEQQEQISSSLDLWYDEMEALHRIHAPEYLAVFNKLFDRIDKILAANQKNEMTRFRKEFVEEHVRYGHMPPPPPPHDKGGDVKPVSNRPY